MSSKSQFQKVAVVVVHRQFVMTPPAACDRIDLWCLLGQIVHSDAVASFAVSLLEMSAAIEH